MARSEDEGRRAARKPCAPRGRGARGRRSARDGARGVGPRGVAAHPRLPQGEGAGARRRRPRRARGALGGGRPQPPRRVVLERRRRRPASGPSRTPRSTSATACRRRARASASPPRSRSFPKPGLADWSQLEVGVPEAEVPEELVDAELESLRAAVAELSPVDDRPAQPGDVAVIDMEGAEIGTTQRDYVVEIGSGRLVDEIEAALRRHVAGETKEVEFELVDERKATVGRDRQRRSRRRSCRRSTTTSRGRPASSRRSPSCAPTSRRGCASSSRRSWSSSSARTRSTHSSTASTFDSLEPLVERADAPSWPTGLRPLARAAGHQPRDLPSMTGQTQDADRRDGSAPRPSRR